VFLFSAVSDQQRKGICVHIGLVLLQQK